MRVRSFILLSLGCAFMLGGCGSSEPGASQQPLDEQGEQSSNFQQARESEDYKRAIEQIDACMASQGYVGDPNAEGIVLADGSVFKNGKSYAVSGAYLDFRIAHEKCQQEAGFEAILQRYGLTSQPQGISPERLRQINEDQVAVMQCMGRNGWEIPEPKTLQGTLIFDIVLEGERQAAWNVDHGTCNTELFGNVRGRE
ncbi:MAG: hypothetical protein ACRDHF_01790 [Tepidiformaceae bacterium]